jgi:hypothetical protein
MIAFFVKLNAESSQKGESALPFPEKLMAAALNV